MIYKFMQNVRYIYLLIQEAAIQWDNDTTAVSIDDIDQSEQKS